MDIYSKDSYLHEHPVCYAIVFDTGYFYIGATSKFNSRVKQHVSAIKNKPEKYLIGIVHNPKSCEIVKLILCDDKKKVFEHEKELIFLNARNKKMINGSPITNAPVKKSLNLIKQSIKNQKL